MKKINFRRKQFNQQQVKELFKINEKIEAPELRIIDDKLKMLGVMPTKEALEMAKERDLDLVEVSPKAQPPVAKFLNYSNYKYQQEKAKRKQKANQKKTEFKEVRLSPRIGQHDFDTKLKQAKKFLDKGGRLSIFVILKGREKKHPDIAKELIANFLKKIGETHEFKVEQETKKQGGNFSSIIIPKA